MTTEKDAVIEDQKTQLRNLNKTIEYWINEWEKSQHRFEYLVEKLEIEISEWSSISKEENKKFEENQ